MCFCNWKSFKILGVSISSLFAFLIKNRITLALDFNRVRHYAGDRFENGGFKLKMPHQTFSVHTTPDLDLFLRKTWAGKFTPKRKAGVFKFLRLEEHLNFRKIPFSWPISVDGRPSRRNRAAFSNSSISFWNFFGVMLTRPSVFSLFTCNSFQIEICLTNKMDYLSFAWISRLYVIFEFAITNCPDSWLNCPPERVKM